MFSQFILNNEATIRLAFFLVIFAVMAIWEVLAPQRVLTLPKAKRWLNNMGLVVFNSIVLRFIFPAAAVGAALFAQQNGWGFFNYYSVPPVIAMIVTVILLDFVIYVQHVMVHAMPILWRLHRVHHADLDYDITTGTRFHTFEMIFSMLIKLMAIMLLGAPAAAVVIFEVLLNVSSMFNHSNIRLPVKLDKWLRYAIVTPDMHRVHHSVEDNETNSNFGFLLPWWDYMFGLYKHQPKDGQLGFTVGINGFRDAKKTNEIIGMLKLPFEGKVTDYAINTRNWDDKNNQDTIEK